MAGIISKMLNFVGIEEERVNESENEVTKSKKQERTWEKPKPQMQNLYNESRNKNKIVNIHSSSSIKVVVIQPHSIEEAREISDYLKDGKPIIVNLEEIEKGSAQRILDFLSGSVYSLDGHIQSVSSTIFLIAPNNVDIINQLKGEDNLDNGVFPWVQ